MSLQAYQKSAARAEDPRATEYRLFAQVTRSLMNAKSLPIESLQDRAQAIDWNRRVWSNLALDCASQDNKLPEALRAAIISLSIFVSKQGSHAMRNPEAIDDLVDINRTVMQGLMPQAAAGAEQAVG
ncbi:MULTISPECIES: flagellar biosynthesis regulator FlaF [Maricaulis]|jgi:flagellar protein FlaF|uniref:Flagellar FlaF family protein n=1 Tax=Maricaulis maris (strain MCS10) TaxID=394221 RepID=Q0AN82_MARMM|nr:MULTISPECIES: flagellar biosynthesis regulator FlaF [Maricaulis]ABI66255.1 flagellar FlaF family protein [Maricaulis maris MCS10]MAC87740.1 flagellar FlaF family protein [Maricaulis sp.]